MAGKLWGQRAQQLVDDCLLAAIRLGKFRAANNRPFDIIGQGIKERLEIPRCCVVVNTLNELFVFYCIHFSASLFESAATHSAAIAPAWKAAGSARSARAIGAGHQRSSHSGKRPVSCGITLSAKSLVLYLARSFPMLPNCKSIIRWPTLRLVATSFSCSATSSGEPMMT